MISSSVELASARWSDAAIQPDDPEQVAYTRMPGFGLANIDMDWRVTDRASIVFGVRNLLDRNYELVESHPEPGRAFFLTTRMRF